MTSNSQNHGKRDQILVVTRRGEWRGNWRKVVIRCKLPIVRQLSTKDVLYNMMTTANTAVRYIGKSSHHKGKLFSPSFLFIETIWEDNGDCSHEIKRHLLLGRKVITNLDSILKSRDVTLPTKVHLVKAVVFPVVMYACESWAVKKAER